MKHKKLLAVGAVCIALLTGGSVLALEAKPHEHLFSTQWSSDAAGHWYACACGEKADSSNHTLEWIVDTEATVEHEGVQHPECTVCDYRGDSVSIPKIHVHTATDTFHSDESGHWQPCICGKKMNPAAHTMEWVVDREATPEADGSRHPECTVCGYKGESESIHIHHALEKYDSDGTSHWQLCRCGEKVNVTKHTLKWIIDKEATPEVDGSKHQECTVCAYQHKPVTVHIHLALEKQYSNGTNHWQLCRCGEKVNVTKHTLKWIIDKEATPEVDGSKHQECTVCAYKHKPVTVHIHLALEKQYSNGTNHWQLCRCGEKVNITKHTLKWIIDKEATPEVDGSKHQECTVCAYQHQPVTVHIHHALEQVYFDDTNHWQLCRCGEKVNVVKHTMEWIVDVAATATTEGLHHAICTACGHTLEGVVIPTTRYSAVDVNNAITAAVTKHGSIGLQVATIKNGKISFVQSYGWAEKDLRPMTDDIKIRIASPTKVVLGMCAMSLVDGGLLDLDAPLSTYWGEGVQNSFHDVQPTTRHLMTHVSSLKLWDAAGRTGLDNLREMLKTNAWTKRTPGDPAAFAYNNFGFSVLGTTLEIASGQTLDAYLHSKFLSPMGIRASLLGGKLNVSEVATMYFPNGNVNLSAEKYVARPFSDVIGEGAPNYCGGLTISAKDYAKLMAILANDGTYNGTRYLSAEAVTAMETPQFQTSSSGGTFNQCLVLRQRNNALGRSSIYYHTGSAYGVYSQMTYDPNTRDGVVVITCGGTASTKTADMNALCASITRDVFAAMKKN